MLQHVPVSWKNVRDRGSGVEHDLRRKHPYLDYEQYDFDVPIGFGLLTCDNKEQEQARAGGEHGNKGWDAALAAMQMADLFDRLDASDES